MNQQWFSFQEWVDVKVLEVNEGGRTLITSEHLRVIVDYGFYGIPESGVLFHMSSAPTRGRLDVSVWNSQDDNIFTLLDLNTDQVSCVKKMYNTIVYILVVSHFRRKMAIFIGQIIEFMS